MNVERGVEPKTSPAGPLRRFVAPSLGNVECRMWNEQCRTHVGHGRRAKSEERNRGGQPPPAVRGANLDRDALRVARRGHRAPIGLDSRPSFLRPSSLAPAPFVAPSLCRFVALKISKARRARIQHHLDISPERATSSAPRLSPFAKWCWKRPDATGHGASLVPRPCALVPSSFVAPSLRRSVAGVRNVESATTPPAPKPR